MFHLKEMLLQVLLKNAVEPFVRNEKKANIIINTKLKGNTLEAMAQSAGVQVASQDSISFNAYTIPAIGNEMAVIGAAFNKSIQGKASSPIAGTTGVFVVKGNGVFASANLGATAQSQQTSMETQLKQQATYRSMSAPRKVADVKDYRSNFY